MLKRSALPAATVDTPRTAHAITALDELFVALDGRHVHAGRRSWVLRVEGIHDGQRGDAWVQVACSVQPERTLVLHVPPRVTSDCVIDALRAWSVLDPPARPPVLHIAPPPR